MTHEAKKIILFSWSQDLDGEKGIKIADLKHHCSKCDWLYLPRWKIKVTCAYTCFEDALSLLFARSMSEPGLKEDERGGPEPILSFEDWASGVRILGREHLWSSILEPWKLIGPFPTIFYLVADSFKAYSSTSQRAEDNECQLFWMQMIYHSFQHL